MSRGSASCKTLRMCCRYAGFYRWPLLGVIRVGLQQLFVATAHVLIRTFSVNFPRSPAVSVVGPDVHVRGIIILVVLVVAWLHFVLWCVGGVGFRFGQLFGLQHGIELCSVPRSCSYLWLIYYFFATYSYEDGLYVYMYAAYPGGYGYCIGML